MPSITSDARFLGIDLRALWDEARRAWVQVQQVAPLTWFTPDIPVRLLQANGEDVLWEESGRQTASGKPEGTPCLALELPEDLLLRRTLVLPAMTAADMASALALQAQAVSPFSESDLAWGARVQPGSEGAYQVDIALASRKQVAQYMQAQASRMEAGVTPEVWATRPGRPPIVFSGYGESQRQARAVRGRKVRYGLLVLALLLLGALAVSPSLQLRSRAIEAVAAYDAAAKRTAPLVQEREALMQTVEKLGVLSGLLAGRIEPLRVLDRFTKVLPDDTALQGLTLKGQKVSINGLTANASALMKTLSEQPGVHDVRAPNPATRTDGPNSKEAFVIEFTLDPQEFGVVAAAPLASSPPQPQLTSPVPATLSAAPQPSVTPSAGQVPAKAPEPVTSEAGKRVPSFGGGARSAP